MMVDEIAMKTAIIEAVNEFQDRLFEWFNSDEVFDPTAYNRCEPYANLVDEFEDKVNEIANELKRGL